MAAVTTHDLPTIAGLWTGADLAEQRALGLVGDGAALDETRGRLAELTGLGPDAAGGDVVEAAHPRPAPAPSLPIPATPDDPLALRARPNRPRPPPERPHWSP